MMSFFHPSLKTLFRYQDRVLSEAKQQKITSHLDICPACQRKYQLLEGARLSCQVPQERLDSLKVAVMAKLETPKWNLKPSVLGSIESLSGKIDVQKGSQGTPMEGFPGMALHPGDILITNTESRAFVRWKDGSRIYLNRETRLELQSVSHRVILPEGEIFSMMLPQEKPFEIRTPGTLMTVLGTDFSVAVSESHKTLLKVYRGKVAYENEKGKVVAHKKESVDSSQFLAPQVQPLKEKENPRGWVRTLSPEGVKKGEEEMNKYLLAIIVILVIIVGVFAYQTYFSPGKAFKPVPSTLSSFPSQPGDKATSVIEAMNRGDFTSVVGLFDSAMQSALNDQKLAEIWKSTQSQLGAYQSQLGVNTTKEQGMDCVYVTCQFANGTTDFKLVFNSQGQMGGLWIVPAFSAAGNDKGEALSEAEAIPLGISYADKLINGDYEAMVVGFDGTMKSALSASGLKSTWEGLEKQVGPFKKRGSARSVPIARSRVVYVTCEFEKASLDMKIVFDPQKQISGLWFIPAGTN